MNDHVSPAVAGRPADSRTFCGYCHKQIRMQRNGAWYHVRNASTSCYFGTGSDKRAFPGGRRAS